MRLILKAITYIALTILSFCLCWDTDSVIPYLLELVCMLYLLGYYLITREE